MNNRTNSLLSNLKQSNSTLFSVIVPVLFLLINLGLKTRYIGWSSLAMDEPFSVYHSQFDIITIIKELSTGNNPPLYEIFLHFWTSLFGINEASVRFPSVVFSSLSAYFIYKVCYKFFNLRIAFLATVLFTVSNYQLFFAQEARVYSLFMLLTIVSMYQFLKLLNNQNSRFDTIIYILINVLLLYSHFFSWFVLFAQVVVLLSTEFKNRQKILQLGKLLGISVLFYLPYLLVFVNRFLNSVDGTWVEPVKNLRPLHTFYNLLVNETHLAFALILIIFWIVLQQYIIRFFQGKLIRTVLILLSVLVLLISLSLNIPLVPSHFFPIENDFSSPTIVTCFLLFYLFIYIHFIRNASRTKNEKTVLSWLFLPCFIMFVSSFVVPMFIDRYLIFFTPAFFIILAIAIEKLGSKLFLSVGLLVTFIMTIPFSPIRNNNRDVKTLVSEIKRLKSDSNSAVFICPDYFVEGFTYYYNQNYFKNISSNIPYQDITQDLNSENIYLVKDHNAVDSIYRTNNFDKMIFLDADANFAYPDNRIKSYFRKELSGITRQIDSTHVPSLFTIYSFEFLEK